MKKLNYLLALLMMVFAVGACDYYEDGGTVYNDRDVSGNITDLGEVLNVPGFKAGDAKFECSQVGDCGFFAEKIEPWDKGDPSGIYPADGGNTITITAYEDEGEYKTFDWVSEFPVCKVIVKASTGAVVYTYDPAVYSDNGLIAFEGRGVSHATFCYNEPDMCYEEETAWAEGARYVKKGNWAMYVPYEGAEKTVDLIADFSNYVNAGSVTFSAPVDGKVTITVNLTGGAIFYYDLNDPLYDNNLKVMDYAKAPTKTPAPGLFLYKTNIETGSTTGSITVPVNNFYGVHLDIALPVPCE